MIIYPFWPVFALSGLQCHKKKYINKISHSFNLFTFLLYCQFSSHSLMQTEYYTINSHVRVSANGRVLWEDFKNGPNYQCNTLAMYSDRVTLFKCSSRELSAYILMVIVCSFKWILFWWISWSIKKVSNDLWISESIQNDLLCTSTTA